jgi:hypothetical protein
MYWRGEYGRLAADNRSLRGEGERLETLLVAAKREVEGGVLLPRKEHHRASTGISIFFKLKSRVPHPPLYYKTTRRLCLTILLDYYLPCAVLPGRD